MKPIVTYFATVLLISGCITNPSTDNPPTQPDNTLERQPVKTASMTCGNSQTQVNQARQAKNLPQLKALLPKVSSSCSEGYTDSVKRELSEIAAAKAKVKVQQGQLEAAEKLLNEYTEVNLWATQVLRGDIAAKRKQWELAAGLYNQSLDLINDPKITPQRPPRSEIERVYRLANETQLLVGTLITVRASGKPSGTLRDDLGIEIRERPIPVQFDSNKAVLNPNGKESAEKLVKYLEHTKPRRVTLIGHTDHHGKVDYNCDLSKKRASALKKHLVDAGIRFPIKIIGKGENAPFELYDSSAYTQEEIDQINRRAEFAIDRDVSYDGACS